MDIKSYMIEYQKENNIKQKCITNSYFMMSFINRMSGSIKTKAKAVIVLGGDI